MVTIEITLTDEQAWRLLDRARYSKRTVSEHVVAVDEQVAEWECQQRREARRRALKAGGAFVSATPDMAEKHDQYYLETLLEEMERWHGEKHRSSDETDEHEQGID